jgi:hypothetical protein
MGISLNSFKESKCLSPETIKEALQERAEGKIKLSGKCLETFGIRLGSE